MLIQGDGSDNLLAGTPSDDTIFGDGGNDTVDAGDGNDLIDGGAGLDRLHGGAGDDIFAVSDGDVVKGEIYDGGAGNDTIQVGQTTADFSGATISSIEHFIASADSVVTMTAAQFLGFRRVETSAGSTTLKLRFNGITDISAEPQPDVTSLVNLQAVGSSGDDTLTVSADEFIRIGLFSLSAGNDTLNVVVAPGSRPLIAGAFPTLSGVEKLNLLGTTGDITLTVAQYPKFTSIAASLTVTLADSAMNLEALTPSQIAALAGRGIDKIDSPLTELRLTAAQVEALGSVTVGDLVTLRDTGANIAGMADFSHLAASGIDRIDATDDRLTLNSAQYFALGTTTLSPDDVLTLTGTTGNDRFTFGAGFSAAPQLDGLAGTDRLTLDGDYAAGLVFNDSTLVNIETIVVTAGHSYKLTLADGNVAAGNTMAVSGSSLGALNSLIFDGSLETNGRFKVTGGAGDDSFTGGNGADSFTGGAGADIIRYTGSAQSTGKGYDTVMGFDATVDRFGVWSGVTGVDAAITTGSLSTATFDANLEFAVHAGNLQAGHAALFTASAGSLMGRTFLVVDANGVAGYQAGADLAVRLSEATHLDTFGTGNFA